MSSNTGKITPASTVIAQRASKRNNSPLTFPHTIGHHAMIFNFKEYTYGNSSHASLMSQSSIVLPLPKTLQDNLNIKVGADELGITGSLAAGSSKGIAELKGANDLGEKMKKMFDSSVSQVNDSAISSMDSMSNAVGTASDIALFMARAGLGAIAPDITKGLGAGVGTAVNPFATLVFSGVDLKTHSFEWLLSPDTPQEAETLRQIIETIQHHITPEVSGLGVGNVGDTFERGLLRYPSMVDCFFHGIDSRYFFQMKTAMISQFNVDYTPNGIALNRGGKPSAVRLTMTMTEASIHTKSDYVPKTIVVDADGAGEVDPNADGGTNEDGKGSLGETGAQ